MEGIGRYLRGRRWLASTVRATMSYTENWKSPQHYDGEVNRKSYTLYGALGNTDVQNKHDPESTPKNQYENCPLAYCHCSGPGGTVCGQPITCGRLSEHFKDAHGIKDTARRVIIPCPWIDCTQQVSRHNFLRHIREFHLKHNRSSNDHSAS